MCLYVCLSIFILPLILRKFDLVFLYEWAACIYLCLYVLFIRIKPAKNECVNISIYQMKDHFTRRKELCQKLWKPKYNLFHSILLSVQKMFDGNEWKNRIHTYYANLFKFISAQMEERISMGVVCTKFMLKTKKKMEEIKRKHINRK